MGRDVEKAALVMVNGIGRTDSAAAVVMGHADGEQADPRPCPVLNLLERHGGILSQKDEPFPISGPE